MSGYPTPMMNRRHQDKIPSMKTYDNWPSMREVERNRKLAISQKEHIRKLSSSKERDADPVNNLVRNSKL